MPNKFVGHGPYHYAAGGHVRKELKFMADKGAPKSMIAAEKKEHGLPAGKAYKFAEGSGEEGIPLPEPGTPEYEDLKRRAEEPAVDPTYREEGRNGPRPEAAAAAPPSFKQAFAAARASGVPAFEWQGKKFTTELAPARPAAARPAPAAAAPPARANPGASVPRKPPVSETPYRSEGRNAPVPPSATGMGVSPKLQAGAVEAARRLQAGRAGGYAAGGSIDGCAQRGKTRAKRG